MTGTYQVVLITACAHSLSWRITTLSALPFDSSSRGRGNVKQSLSTLIAAPCGMKSGRSGSGDPRRTLKSLSLLNGSELNISVIGEPGCFHSMLY
ncbi:hypothetical protein TNCV_1661541 [Trichonephila clavipes]|nr:hypothetical protein TNCV_1661541 [Trichonephila clavipes]